MKIESFELRCPAELIEEVAGRVPLADDKAYAVLVGDPSRTQEVRAVAELTCGSSIEDNADVRQLLEELDTRWDPGVQNLPCDVIVVTILVRRGLCVWTPVEWAWARAWCYALTRLSVGDLITVTEHGWCDFITEHADHQPALVEA